MANPDEVLAYLDAEKKRVLAQDSLVSKLTAERDLALKLSRDAIEQAECALEILKGYAEMHADLMAAYKRLAEKC